MFSATKKGYTLKHIIYSTLLLNSLLFADIESEKNYVETQTLIDYALLSQQKQSCLIHPNIRKTCIERKISYPDISTIQDKDIVILIKDDIKKIKENFQKEELLKELKDEDTIERSDTELYEHDTYDIFAFTPKTLTIEQTNSSYGGGAHGNFATMYSNIDKESKKELTLQDILKPNQKKAFTQFVEQFYRKQHQLKKNDSMKEAGWFNDEFTLAENFAITPKGLYFLYNSYEVQPYAMGQETILLPYNKIKKFLSEKYFDQATLKQIELLAHTYKRVFNDSLKIQISPSKENHIKIKITAKNTLYDTTQGWLSISFKELKSKNIEVTLLHKEFDDFKIYPAGSKIYNIKKKKAIKSHYLLVEAETKKWLNEEEKELEFTIKVPKNIKHLNILLRTVQKLNKQIIEPNKEFNEGLVEGQQGHNNFLLTIDI
jgi:hypothetical protein